MIENDNYNTRFKQIEKLYSMSLEYIHKFGYLQFIKSAILTLRHEGLSLFSPSIIRNQIYDQLITSDSFSNYASWLNKQKYFRDISPKDSIKNFAVIIDFQENEYEKQNVENNIKNLLRFNFIKKIYLVSFNSDEISVSDSRIEFLEKNNLAEWTSSDIDYFIFQKPNVIINSDGILQLLDFLEQNSDFDLLYSDEDKTSFNQRVSPFFKPNWSPFLLFHFDYISNFFVIPKSKLKIKTFKSYLDLIFQITDTGKNISHLSYPVVSTYKDVFVNEIQIIDETLRRRKIKAKATPGKLSYNYNISFDLVKKPKVSIIIPTKDHKKILKRCINSIEKKTNYTNFEIIISDNNSTKKETHDYYASLNHKIITSKELFNFSKINNNAVKESNGDLLLFLNDDVAVLEKNWLDNLVGIILQKEIGAVCPKLIFSDNTIQHAGIAFLKTGSGFHPFVKYPHSDPGYFGLANTSRECSAVTAACLMTTRTIFDEIGGFDEIFDLYYGDSDLCFKIRNLGYSVIYDANTILLHEGSSKTKEFSDSFFAIENHYDFVSKWPDIKKGDPYYNKNLDWNYSLNMD